MDKTKKYFLKQKTGMFNKEDTQKKALNRPLSLHISMKLYSYSYSHLKITGLSVKHMLLIL